LYSKQVARFKKSFNRNKIIAITLYTANMFLTKIKMTLLKVGNHENEEIITFIS
jgi:hypothetical protein